jgi:hypothetical protein
VTFWKWKKEFFYTGGEMLNLTPHSASHLGKKEGKISISVKITQNTPTFFFWARLLSFVHDSHTA